MRKIVASLLLALGAVACSEGTLPGAGPGPSNGVSSSPSTSPSPVTTETTLVEIYYLVAAPGGGEREGKLFITPERHRVAKTPAIARAALEELVHGKAQDPDHSTPFPRESTINSVVIKDKVATVDWSAEVLTASAGAETESLGIQSVVYTLTEFSSISTVRFTVEGKDRGAASNGRTIEDFWGHVGLSGQPWDRDEALEVLAPITLFTPQNGTTSTGILKLTGEATTFEANVGIQLRDASGRMKVQTSTTASIGGPGRGTFSKTITFDPPATPQTWTLYVIEDSAKDGSVVFQETRSIWVG